MINQIDLWKEIIATANNEDPEYSYNLFKTSLQTQKSELIEKIREKFELDWFCSDYLDDETERINIILDTFKQAEKIE